MKKTLVTLLDSGSQPEDPRTEIALAACRGKSALLQREIKLLSDGGHQIILGSGAPPTGSWTVLQRRELGQCRCREGQFK